MSFGRPPESVPGDAESAKRCGPVDDASTVVDCGETDLGAGAAVTEEVPGGGGGGAIAAGAVAEVGAEDGAGTGRALGRITKTHTITTATAAEIAATATKGRARESPLVMRSFRDGPPWKEKSPNSVSASL